MFLRRLYYNPDDGKILYSHCISGEIAPAPIIEEMQTISVLKKCTGRISCLEWTQYDADREACFMCAVSVRVEGGKPVFDFRLPIIPIPTSV